jgi:hypothetical protein
MALPKKVTVDIFRDGRMTMEFDCYPGSECFVDAEKLKQAMAAQGLDVEEVSVTKKRDEVEMRRQENKQTTRAR